MSGLDRALFKETVGSSTLLVLYVSNELGTEFSMSHDLRSTIVLLKTTFKSAEIKQQKKIKNKSNS